MSLSLTVKATYKEAEDLAEVLLYLYESADKSYHPEKLLSGKVEFFFASDGNQTKMSETELNKYHGNADGAFRVYVAHPVSLEGLSYRAEFTVEGVAALIKSGTFEVIPAPEVKAVLPEQPIDGMVPQKLAPGKDR